MITIYTDGACSGNPGKGGWGVVILEKDNEPVYLNGGDDNTTNNRMELAAAINALSYFNDTKEIKPAPIKKNDNYEYLTFNRYNSTYANDIGVSYIVEESSDRRTWSTISLPQDSIDIGGGMERVVYRTTSQTSAGATQFIRVRVKSK